MSEILTVGLCKDCRWWMQREDWPGNAPGTCDLTVTENATPQHPETSACSGVVVSVAAGLRFGVLETLPSFGCVQFAAKVPLRPNQHVIIQGEDVLWDGHIDGETGQFEGTITREGDGQVFAITGDTIEIWYCNIAMTRRSQFLLCSAAATPETKTRSDTDRILGMARHNRIRGADWSWQQVAAAK